MMNPIFWASEGLLAFATQSAMGLLVWSWQAAVLLACVWAGLKIFRVKSPTLRHQVWLFALIAVATMPALSGLVQSLPLPKTNNIALSYAVELPRIVVTNDVAPIAQTPSRAASVKPSTKKPVILSLVFALWIAGVCAIVMTSAVNGLRLRRLRAGARLASLADLDCDEWNCEVLQTGKARLALSDEIHSPILLGVLRPVIVFPADIASWTSPMERSAMLRHELAHVERRDHYANLFQTVFGAVFFFHPLARYACRQLALEREMACDDHVVCSGAEAESYAESIIKAAERGIGAPRGARQLALFGTRQILERRIEMILNKDRLRVFRNQWRHLFLSIAMIAAISVLLISGHAGKIAAQPAIVNNDEQILIAMVRQVAEGIPRQINLGEPSPNSHLEYSYFIGPTGESIKQTLESFARRNLKVTRVEVADFELGFIADTMETDGDHIRVSDNSSARIDFFGAIHFKNSAGVEERGPNEQYTVTMVKVNGQWQAVPPPPPPPPRRPRAGIDPPPPPPPPPSGLMTVEAGQEFKPIIGNKVESLYDLLREAAAASIRRDTEFFERVLDENYQETGPNGEIMNKAQAIADVKRLDYTLKKFEFDDLNISGNNHSAFVTFLGTVYFETNGQDSTAQFRYTVNFIRREGKWKIAAIHMTQKH
jgi:beta-lactamase regulating signal transducer with metallopeptidase domain